MIVAMGTLFLVACAAKSDKTKNNDMNTENSKVLVAYFSATGHTKALAEKVAKVTGGDLFEIEPAEPYTDADLDWRDDSSRSSVEAKDRSTRPAVKSHVDNIAQYDTIYVGFPIWWYTAPVIVNTFLEGYDTAGKVIIPFATSGGSQIGETEKDLRVSAPKAIFKPGKVMNGYSEEQVAAWVEQTK